MTGPAGLRGKARVGDEQFGLADDVEEALPLAVVIDQDAEIAVGGAIGTAMGGKQAVIAGLSLRRLEGASRHVVGQNEMGDALEHRHFDFLALAAPFPRVKGGGDRVDHMQAGDPVGQRNRHIGRFAAGILLYQPGDAGGALDQIVIGGLVGVRPASAITAGADIDQARIAPHQRLVIQPQPLHGSRAHIRQQYIRLVGQSDQGRARRRLL